MCLVFVSDQNYLLREYNMFATPPALNFGRFTRAIIINSSLGLKFGTVRKSEIQSGIKNSLIVIHCTNKLVQSLFNTFYLLI